MTDKEYYDELWQRCCHRVLAMLVVLLACGWLLLLAGCKTKERVVQAQIIHDSVFIARDGVVYRLVQDSVVERQQTTSTAKGDTIFVDRLREVERWKIRTDTVRLVQYVKERTDSTRSNEVTKIEQRPSSWHPPALLWVWLVFAAGTGIILIRARLGR